MVGDGIIKKLILSLKLSEVFLNYGYVLKDCHPYNILFQGGHPMYIDIGGFKKNNRLLEVDEFLSYYYQILKIMKTNYKFARDTLKENHAMNMKNNLLYIWGSERLYIVNLIMYFHDIRKKFYIRLKNKFLPSKTVNNFLICKYRNSILKLKSEKHTEWGWY